MKSQLNIGNFFDIPTGEYMMSAFTSGINKSRPMTMTQEIELMRSIYDFPPESKERYQRITEYLQRCCSLFCKATYNPDVDAHPIVVWSDIEGDMEWFSVLLKKMATATKDQVEDPDREENNLAFKMFMDYHDPDVEKVTIDSMSKVTG